MAFTQDTLDFLFTNYINNSKIWYNEHKSDYLSFIKEPFSDFMLALQPTMLSIDTDIICEPKKVSRLYRDARFAKGKSIFRDSVFCSICRKKEPFVCIPEYYFYISLNGFGYGCGYYSASRESMDAMRELIIKKDKAFLAAKKALESQSIFRLEGELYKKNHYPNESEDIGNWLNRKSLCISADFTEPALLFEDTLAQQVSKAFAQIAPVYHFYLKAEKIAREKKHSLAQ